MKIKGFYQKPIPPTPPSLGGSIDSVIKVKTELENLHKNVVETVDTKIQEVDATVGEALKSIESKGEVLDQKIIEAEKSAIQMITDIKNIPHFKGDPGKDAEPVDTEKLKTEILAKIPKVDESSIAKKAASLIPENKPSLKIIKETIASDPMAIIDAIMSLPDGKFKLKTSNIDGLDQTIRAFKTQVRNKGYIHGGGDTVVAGTNITLVKLADGKTQINASGGGTVGPGTTNEIAYFNAPTTITSLTTATYPSLTELSYVKGVTSAIQTQLNGKQPLNTKLTNFAALANGSGALTNDGSGNYSWVAAGGTGTVTTVSVVSANGFAGTVANATTTPAITLTTSITGVLKGNGTAISAATAGSDYAVGSIGLAGGQTIAGSTLTAENLTLRANAADLTTGAVIVTSSKEASSSTVGSVQLAGGLAVAKRVFALDMTVTNTITGSVTGNAGTVSNATFTTALTVNGGTLTLTANAANTSVLTIGAGAVSVSGTNTGDQTTVSGNAGTATALQNARTLWGQSFDGTGNITGSQTGIGDMTGGASSMVITAGTGNSRTLTLRSTTSGGVATAFITGNADQSTTFGGNLTVGANSITMTGSLAATGARVTKGWFTDVESTNMYTVGGTSLSSTFAAIGQAMFIGTTSVAINRSSAALTLAGITLTTPVLGVASATSLATSAASPLLLTNGQLVTIALTSQTTGATTLTIPDFASVSDEFTFKTKAQTMSNKTFVAPALGTVASGVISACTSTSMVMVTPLLGTPTSGVLTNCTGLPAASVVAGSLGTGAYVMDTKLTVPQIINTSNAITASANAATVPITSRISTVTNNSAATLTITITTTSAVDGQMVIVRILDFSGVTQTITWVNTENSTVLAPTTSNGSTTLPLTVGFQYNNATSKWRCIASA